MSDPVTVNRAYPEALAQAERALAAERRRKAGIEGTEAQVGFGLSGGGIRSATFSLGAFQALAAKGLLKRIDFLSTVSGGGYFGAFLGRLMTRDFVKSPEDAEQILQEQKEPGILRYLRENGRYLAPNGGGDSLLAGAVLLRNFVAVQILLGLFVSMIFLALQAVRAGLATSLSCKMVSETVDVFRTAWGIWWSPWLVLPLVAFLLAVFPLGWAYWLIEPSRRIARQDVQRSGIHPLAGLLLVFVASLLLLLLDDRFPALWGAILLVTVLTVLWWAAARWWPLPSREPSATADQQADLDLYRYHTMVSRLSLWLTRALVVTFVLLAVGVIDSLGQTLYLLLLAHGALGPLLASAWSSVAAAAGFARSIVASFSNGPGGLRAKPPVRLLAGAAALLLALLLLVSFDALSHAVAWKLGRPENVASLAKPARGLWKVQVSGPSKTLPLHLTVDSSPVPPTPDKTAAVARDFWPPTLGFAIAFLLSILLGQTWPFVNRSSHHPVYSARLTRAYLGASNKLRFKEGRSITEVLPGDDDDLDRYWRALAESAAPIHLINVTINETVDGRSQVQQQDRKGVGLALGPCGLSAGVEHHAVVPPGGSPGSLFSPGSQVKIQPDPQAFRVFEYPQVDGTPVFTGEPLPLGSWVGISGAAFSTGIGMQTSLGLSFLAGFGNVRLGRWWDSGFDRRPLHEKLGVHCERLLARLFPVQVLIVDEFLARFPGTARRHWYLSDGGHFENMGGYELLRRRLPLIVIVDAECDTDYGFGGLANLVRKARLDLGAEIEFMQEEELDERIDDKVRPYLGTLEQLRRGSREHGELTADPTGTSTAHAALARVTYCRPESPPSLLLYIKPTLTGDEPTDVLEYHSSHSAFPHETTADQFFDETQWESYRKLGHHIASALFDSSDASGSSWSALRTEAPTPPG
jgi:hypothetical protein